MKSKRKILEKRFEVDSDGCKCRGKIMFPSKKKNQPVVIISHGFGGCMKDTKINAKLFAELGYVAVYFDFCRSGCRTKSTGKTTEMSVLTQKNDLIRVIDYIKEQPFCDKDRIYLLGLSQGGFVSALAAAEREDDVKELLMYYPALCIPDDVRNGRALNGVFDKDNPPETVMSLYLKLGKKFITDAAKLDPYKEICTFKKPVLIIHGTEDALVSVDYSRKAAEQYENCRLIEIHGDHGFSGDSYAECEALTIKYMTGKLN
ncbi:MAG: alpha/beta hydrolase [Lachnospiraceae bacterium]|nr:alpha/beta hydrolase [Lachnospiraceae bacterium]